MLSDLAIHSGRHPKFRVADGAGRASEKNPATHVHGPSHPADLDLPAPTT
jgi:hypothetical protein